MWCSAALRVPGWLLQQPRSAAAVLAGLQGVEQALQELRTRVGVHVCNQCFEQYLNDVFTFLSSGFAQQVRAGLLGLASAGPRQSQVP